MLDILFGIAAVAGGLGYVVMADASRKLLGFIPALMWVIPFGLELSGEPLDFGLHIVLSLAAAILGGVLFSRGRIEKIRRVAETGEE